MIERKRVLAVDDSVSHTQLLKLYLEGIGDYVVKEVNDPRIAILVAEEFQPHIILLDLMMPNMDGGELADCFRANPKFNDVQIIFLTSQVTKEQVEMCNGRIGRYSFLAKPVILAELVVCLRLYLGIK